MVHPVLERKSESLLLAVESFPRNADAFGELEQDVFLLAAAQLPCGGEAGGPLDEFVVEDGNAHFERIQHAHAVDLGKDVADHVGFGIHVEKLADRVVGGAVGEVTAESVAGFVAGAKNIAETIGEQRQVAFKTGDERQLIDVTLLPGQRNVVGESAPAHGAGQARKDLVAKEPSRPTGNVLEDAAIGVNAVASVSGKHLVTTVTGKGYGYMLAGHLRNVIGGQHGRIAERFFERTGEQVDGLDYVGFEDHLMMIGGETLSDDAGVVSLVEIVPGETDAEGLDGAGTGAGHHGDHGGRIDSAAEESAERDVGDEADARGFEQAAFQLFQALFVALGEIGIVGRQVPILADADLPVLEFQQMPGRKFMNSGERGNGIGNVAEIKIFEQGLGIDFGEFGSDGEDRLDFGCEVKIPFVKRVVQRLLAQAVARQDQLALGLVVDGEGKHAAQFLDAVGAHFFVEMNDDFGIGVGVEAVAAVFELRAKFGKVVDLAVVNDPGAAVFVENGLMASGKVDDGEAAHAETSTIGDVDSLVVGASVHNLLAHVVHESFGDVAFAGCAYHSGNATHGSGIYPFRSTWTAADSSAACDTSAKRLSR